MVITFVCDVLGQENNGTTIATMNVIRSLRSKGHEVRIVCPDQDKIGQPGYYVVPAINFGIFSHYVASNGVCPASGKDLGPLKEALEGCDIVHFNFCGMLSGKACDYAHSLGIPCTASLHTQAENFTNHLKLENFYPANKLVYPWLYRSSMTSLRRSTISIRSLTSSPMESKRLFNGRRLNVQPNIRISSSSSIPPVTRPRRLISNC